MDQIIMCEWAQSSFLIFSENVFSPLIYYSHIAPLMVSLLLGGFVLFNNPRALIHRTLFALTFFFSLWVYIDLILWASEKPEYIMFFWSIIVPIELLLYATGWYFVATFINEGQAPSLRQHLVAAMTFIPMLFFTHTSYNLLGFDLTDCDREAIEGPLVQYLYLIELFYVGWIIHIGISAYQRAKSEQKLPVALVTFGTALFLFMFSIGNILVSYFLEVDWSYEQYKLFGMPLFVAVLMYSAVRFKTFDSRIFTAQILVITLAVSVFSLLFIQDLRVIHIVTVATFALVCAIGYLLIRNVRTEIEQRILIEKQEKELEAVNQQQESLLHFVSHEVKGFLTDGQNTFAGIIEGDFGEPPATMRDIARTALGKMRSGVATVMDILDAANLKKGTVSFKKKEFNIAHAVAEVCNDMSLAANSKSINVTCTVADKQIQFNGDEDKIKRQVIRNLIDNSIRYTPQGTVDVTLSKARDVVRFEVKDTGIGITSEDMSKLFTEGGHGKDSIRTNVNSTGFGLFVAKSVVDAHGGKIWAESEGEGKGSRFVVELPVVK